jgi:ubiquinone/menaquinone biosynthesis C-methylase UbiE
MPHDLKESVRNFWNEKACGEVYAAGIDLREQLENQARTRYAIEPELNSFADYRAAGGKDVLEIGVGMGADHLEWAKAHPRSLSGIDLTERAIRFTADRLHLYGLRSNLCLADAENLPFSSASFDIIYAWGVLHHSPDTARAIQEVHRVLRPGGIAKVLIYHSRAIVGYLLWLRYGLFALRPSRTLSDIYAHHLESPGTKAFSIAEGQSLFASFSSVDLRVALGPGDLLEGSVGQRHRGPLLSIAKAVWPRWLIRRTMQGHGGAMLITAVK